MTSYCHDPSGRLKEELTKTPAGAPVGDYSYVYDVDGNRTTGTEGGHGFTAVNQLTDTGAAFDANGNQTQPNRLGYNANDQTTSFGGTNVTYAGADQKECTSLDSTT